MKRSTLLLMVTAVLLLGFGSTLFVQKEKEVELQLEEISPSQDPKAQAARLTSHLLIRKIEQLRNTAVYLQHR